MFKSYADHSGNLLDNTFRIDSTDVHADTRDDEASWNYDPTAGAADTDADKSEELDQDTSDDEQDDDGGGYYFGYGCLVVTTGPNLLVAAPFTDQK